MNKEISIRDFCLEDKEFVLQTQLKLYADERGFTTDAWKRYLLESVQLFFDHFDEKRDVMYILQKNEEKCGCVAIAHTKENAAQLRFLFVSANLRGFGAGGKLVDMAVDFCRQKKYESVFLWTENGLEAARRLYAGRGFKIRETMENKTWGTPVTEERWVLRL